MGARDISSVPPAPSALQTYIKSNTTAASPHPAHLQHLTLQICHNLRYQHNWTDLTIYHYAPITHSVSDSDSNKRKRTPLPRPLISGLPPQRLYVHPDEQIALLQAAKKSSSTTETEGATDLTKLVKPEPEREWILPSHLKEKWSLRRFGEVFDQIGFVPPESGADDDLERETVEEEGGQQNPWRTKKRVVLATLDDDSTVMYYIVHDGIVKPRQN
ncbi:Sen15 protein [Elsinoe australis]|uniref:Sen15 protein n=1 Tax=Elsinoe australis TaxID=40998 RepID=A0A4U7AXY5_9PEZI|nr:Sen15 protein [Elsinoe australis]